jgi:hypothetical protein
MQHRVQQSSLCESQSRVLSTCKLLLANSTQSSTGQVCKDAARKQQHIDRKHLVPYRLAACPSAHTHMQQKRPTVEKAVAESHAWLLTLTFEKALPAPDGWNELSSSSICASTWQHVQQYRLALVPVRLLWALCMTSKLRVVCLQQVRLRLLWALCMTSQLCLVCLQQVWLCIHTGALLTSHTDLATLTRGTFPTASSFADLMLRTGPAETRAKPCQSRYTVQ